MKERKLTLLLSISLILVLVASLVLVACAPAAPTAPAPAPTKPAPTKPAPAKPAPAKPAPAKPAPAPEAEVIKYKVGLHYASGASSQYIFHKTVLPRIVEERTNGRILMDPIYGAGELVTADQSLEAAATGLLNFVEGSPSYWKGTIPVAEIETGLPLAWASPMEMDIFIFKYGVAEILEEAYAEKGIRWLTTLPNVSGHTLITREKIAGLDDLRGLKLITFGPYLPLMESLGGSATYIVAPERYTAVATGVVDAVLTSLIWLYDNKFYELCKYFVQPYFQGSAADQYIMNLDDWNALNPDLQDTFHMAIREVAHNWMMDFSMAGLTYPAKWQQQGVEFVTWSGSDWAQVVAAAAVSWDDIAAKDAYTAKAIGIQKDLLRELGRLE